MPRRIDFFPELLQKDWWNATNYPRQLLGQKIALVLSDEDLSNSDALVYKGFKLRPRMPASMKASGKSQVKNDEEAFQVSLDLDEFEIEEIDIQKYDSYIEIFGKHEEKRDKFGLVSREFHRRYMIPQDCNIDDVTASFSTDGKLTIKVPKSGIAPQLFEPVLVPFKVKK